MDQKQEKEIISLSATYKSFFSGPEGRKILEDMMDKFHVRSVAKGTDPYDTYFKDGQRSVVMHIMGHLNMNADKWRRILTQNDGADNDI